MRRRLLLAFVLLPFALLRPASALPGADGPITEAETFAGPFHVAAKRTRQITFTYTINAETDWQIDLPTFGVQRQTWLHQYVVPYRLQGKPTWDGFQLRESFALTER